MRIQLRGRFRQSLLLACLVTVSPLAVLAQAQSRQELPDSPGVVIARRVVEAKLIEPQTVTSSSTGQQSAQAPPTQPQAQTRSDTMQKPVGTAVAVTPPTTGFAASNPAGAAIAPARQRRVRTIFIGVAAVVGAGVALGTVAALESASPSRPPGSR